MESTHLSLTMHPFFIIDHYSRLARMFLSDQPTWFFRTFIHLNQSWVWCLVPRLATAPLGCRQVLCCLSGISICDLSNQGYVMCPVSRPAVTPVSLTSNDE